VWNVLTTCVLDSYKKESSGHHVQQFSLDVEGLYTNRGSNVARLLTMAF
jgi:hypothetical protein